MRQASIQDSKMARPSLSTVFYLIYFNTDDGDYPLKTSTTDGYLQLVGEAGSGPTKISLIPNIVHSVGHEGKGNRCGRQADYDCPAIAVKRLVFRPKELPAHDAGAVGRHDVDSHCHRTLPGRFRVQRKPGTIHGICCYLAKLHFR